MRSRLSEPSDSSFSVSYLVDRGTEVGFCKVINYGRLMKVSLDNDPVAKLRDATSIYEFERDLARGCANLSRVVTAIDDGSTNIRGFRNDLVSYIIFEVAEQDSRILLNSTTSLDVAIKLRLLQNLAAGIRQLHSRRIAHQDVKPANLLVFRSTDPARPRAPERTAKVSDLGHAAVMGKAGPYDARPFAGDYAYAPPEVLYGAIPEGFAERRMAGDLYQLGGMIAYCMTATPFNAMLKQELEEPHHWTEWTGSYEDVRPYLVDAIGKVVHRVGERTPETIRDDLSDMLHQLCHPDPRQRGDRRARGVDRQYSLTRFVTKLDLMARRAELEARQS